MDPVFKISTGSRKIEENLKRLPHSIRKGLRHGLYTAGKQLKDSANDDILRGTKTGRFYKTHGRNIRASAPGEAVANRTGNLRRSIDFRVEGSDALRFGIGVEYGEFTELGTRNMEERPTLGRAVEKKQGQIQSILLESLRAALEGRIK